MAGFGCPNNFVNTLFDDQAATNLQAVSEGFTGSYNTPSQTQSGLLRGAIIDDGAIQFTVQDNSGQASGQLALLNLKRNNQGNCPVLDGNWTITGSLHPATESVVYQATAMNGVFVSTGFETSDTEQFVTWSRIALRTLSDCRVVGTYRVPSRGIEGTVGGVIRSTNEVWMVVRAGDRSGLFRARR